MSGLKNYTQYPVDPLQRLPEDYIEIVYLSIIIFFGILLNTGVFIQLMRQSRTPTASTSFLTGPYQLSSFNLFKMNLCLTDFAIVLVHALGKIIWLSTLDWRMGGYYGCKIYQFLSAFTYYSNNNVVVSIGLDRLKVVYTSHIQGATSVRRVRNLLIFSWSLSALCSLPQLYVWETIELADYNYVQCTTFWEIAEHRNQSSDFMKTTLMLYEMSHQAFVFWFPFIILLSSYLLIVVRVVHYTLHPTNSTTQNRRKHGIKNNRYTNPIYLENRLLSNSIENFTSEYHFSYSAATEKTEMSVGGEPSSSRSLPWNISAEKSVRLPFLQRLKRNFDCLLAGTTFSQSIVEKRKAVCCGTVRACCLNAETGNVNFRPLGLRKPPSGSPLWRRQLRSRIFITSLAIVTTHFLLWLPYNLLNTLRFIHEPSHVWLQAWGANLLEDLIVLNSVLNPILYAYEQK